MAAGFARYSRNRNVSGLAMPHQVALLLALDEGMLDSLPLEKVAGFRNSLAQWLGENAAAPIERIRSTGELDDATRAALLRSMAEHVAHVAGSAAAVAGPRAR